MKDSIKREQSELAHSGERENLRPKGKKIINPWRNHEGYNCFGCSPDNPIGLHMEFYEDGDYIVSTWHPEHNYQGGSLRTYRTTSLEVRLSNTQIRILCNL